MIISIASACQGARTEVGNEFQWRSLIKGLPKAIKHCSESDG